MTIHKGLPATWWGYAGRSIRRSRQGIVLVLTCLLVPVLLAFVALSVDTGLMTMTLTRMQNAADAASLAASQEITGAISEAAKGNGSAIIDANSIAVANAKARAQQVAAANGVYINPDRDVLFGKRVFDEASGTWPIQWGVEPYNVVRVVTHRDNANPQAPDGALRLNFGTFVNKPTVPLSAGASAFVEARDLVLVLDYSGSMNDDSELRSISKLGRAAVEQNVSDIFQALGPPNVGSMTFQPQYLTVVGQPPQNNSQPQIQVTFKGTSILAASTKDLSNVVLQFSNGAVEKHDGLSGLSGEFAGTGRNRNRRIVKCWVKSGANASGEGPGYGERFEDTVAAVKTAFNLNTTPYPYPSGSWTEFINHCRYDYSVRRGGYRSMYGGMTFVDYLLRRRRLHSQTPDLWKTPHYPFHAMKNGVSLLLNFLTELDFGDQVGIISYATDARWETTLFEDGYNIDLSADPITSDYASLDAIQRHRQAGHYSNMTDMGDGILQARLLLQQYIRYGARPTVLVITDGNTNQMPSGWKQPADWNWADWTDYDGDGYPNYTTNNVRKQYAFWEATQGINLGFTFHTMTVGASADRALMKALAFAGKGTWIDVPGGATIADMQAQMLRAFGEMAGKVPPPMLVYGNGPP